MGFRDDILKRKGKGVKTAKVRNSYGVAEAYNYLRKNSDLPYGIQQFMKIVREVGNIIREKLSEGEEIILPEHMGKLEIRKRGTYIKFQDNKLKTNLPIDWNATLNLWEEDQESFAAKRIVRRENKIVHHIFYNKHSANYKNKVFYHFKPNRELKLKLCKNIDEGMIEAPLLYKERK